MFNYTSPQRSEQSGKPHTTRTEVQWPPFPEAALYPFSSAVQFVSTTLKPLTEPTIAYPAGPLPNRLSRANGLLLSSSSRLTSLPSLISPLHSATQSSNGGLKRSRTTTSSSIPNSISRKRSKSDFGGVNDRNRPRLGPKDVHSPAFLIRQKQRHSDSPADKSHRKKNSHTSPYPQYMHSATRSTTSLKSNASVTSMNALYPTRARAYSQVSAKSSRLKEEIHQIGPVRATYLGGVGVYLSHDHLNEESIQEEKDCLLPDNINNSKYKPHLTIDVGLSNNGPELLKNVGHWYNRLLISPLTSASSSVLSFLVSNTSASTSSEDPDTLLSEEESGTSPIPIKTKANRTRSQK